MGRTGFAPVDAPVCQERRQISNRRHDSAKAGPVVLNVLRSPRRFPLNDFVDGERVALMHVLTTDFELRRDGRFLVCLTLRSRPERERDGCVALRSIRRLIIAKYGDTSYSSERKHAL